MRFATPLFVVIGIAAAGQAIAQDAVPCRQPVLAHLAFLPGEWDVTARTRLGANPVVWEDSTATARFESLSRDCVVMERFRGSRRGKPFELLRILTARPQGEGLQLSLTDSEHGPLFGFESTTDEPLLFTARITTANGPVSLRQRISEVGVDRFVLTAERSADGGSTWDLTGRAEYRRAPAHTAEAAAGSKNRSSGPPEDVRAVRKLVAANAQANNAGDVDGWVALFAPDFVYMAPGMPAVTTRAELIEVGRAGFRHRANIRIEPLETHVAGDWAYTRNAVGGTVTLADSGEVVTIDLKQLAIFARGTDGRWRIARLITNANG